MSGLDRITATSPITEKDETVNQQDDCPVAGSLEQEDIPEQENQPEQGDQLGQEDNSIDKVDNDTDDGSDSQSAHSWASPTVMQRTTFEEYAQWRLKILTLHPGQHDDVIVCELRETTFLEAKGTYEAISYLWGDATFRNSISVNGQPFHVTDNLEIALRGLRNIDQPRVLWIDGICIDQSNDAEKNEQVGRMWAIYAEARRVIAWLGSEQFWTRDAFRFITTQGPLLLDESFDDFVRGPTPIEGMTNDTGYQGDDDGDLREQQQLRQEKQACWNLELLQYFSRVWMALELAVNDETYIMSGPFVAPLEWFEAVIDRVDGPLDNLEPPRVFGLLAVRGFYNQSLDWPSQGPAPIQFLNALRAHEASDAKDKVYALRLFLEPSITVTVEYGSSTTVKDVFKHVFQSLIHSGSLEALDYIQSSHYTDLPSWCPDWRTGTYLGEVKPTFSLPKLQPANPVFEGDVLHLRGSTVATVAATGLHDKITAALKVNDEFLQGWTGDKVPAAEVGDFICAFYGATSLHCVQKHGSFYRIKGPCLLYREKMARSEVAQPRTERSFFDEMMDDLDMGRLPVQRFSFI